MCASIDVVIVVLLKSATEWLLFQKFHFSPRNPSTLVKKTEPSDLTQYHSYRYNITTTKCAVRTVCLPIFRREIFTIRSVNRDTVAAGHMVPPFLYR